MNRIETNPTSSELRIRISGITAGYGHIRAALAFFDAMISWEKKSVDVKKIKVEFYDPIAHGTEPFKKYLRFLDVALAAAYNKFPRLFLKLTASGGGTQGMGIINWLGEFLDWGKFDQSLNKETAVVVATHSLIADLSHKNPTFLLALDPWAGLYNARDHKVTIFTPDLPTAVGLKNIKDRQLVVTGPFIAKPVVDARNGFEARKKELQEEAPIRVTIATGGSGSHPEEIIALTRAYARAIENYEPIEKLTVVAGSSKLIRDKVEFIIHSLPADLQEKITVLYNPDEIQLIRDADIAIANSDVLHAKTGELVYCVAKGLAFETFGSNPSLAVQEVKLREYSHMKTMVRDKKTGGIRSALEFGNVDANREIKNLLKEYSIDDLKKDSTHVELDINQKINQILEKHVLSTNAMIEENATREVAKIFEQLRDGELLLRMEAGLGVPANGAEYAAAIVKNELKRIYSTNSGLQL